MGTDTVVNSSSGAYWAGAATGLYISVAAWELAAAKATIGLGTKVATHPAHHAFGSLGKLRHLQINWWRAGIPNSDNVIRISLPWR